MFINVKFISILNAVISMYVAMVYVCMYVYVSASERKFVYHFCSNVQLRIITNNHNGLLLLKNINATRFSVASRKANAAVDCLI